MRTTATAAPGVLAAVDQPRRRQATRAIAASTRTATGLTTTAVSLTTGRLTAAVASRTTPAASLMGAGASRLMPGASRVTTLDLTGTTPEAGGRPAGSLMTRVAGATGTAAGPTTPAVSRMFRRSEAIRARRLGRCQRPLVGRRLACLRSGRRPLGGRRADRRRSASRWRTGSQRTGPVVTGLRRNGRPATGRCLEGRRDQGRAGLGRMAVRRTATYRRRAAGCRRLRAGDQGTGLWTLRLRASGVLTRGTRARRRSGQAAGTAVTATRA